MKRNIASLLALLVVGIVAAAGASAFMGGLFTSQSDRQSLQQAIASNDFNTWKSLMEKQLTQDNFNKLVQMYQARTQRMAAEQSVRNAISSGDYNAYISATQNLTATEVMTQTQFNNLVAAYQARQNSTSQANRQSFGFGRMGMHGWMMR